MPARPSHALSSALLAVRLSLRRRVGRKVLVDLIDFNTEKTVDI